MANPDGAKSNQKYKATGGCSRKRANRLYLPEWNSLGKKLPGKARFTEGILIQLKTYRFGLEIGKEIL